MMCFTVELAETPVEIRCRYPQNRRFFRDYLSDRRPALTVAPSDADALQIKARYLELHGPDAQASPDWFWENQAIHWKLSESLLFHGALLFHASALAFDGNALLFTANSGVGKSTHAALWRQRFGERVSMIDDDKPYLKVTERGIFACGTPWNGKHHLGRNAAAPVRAIFELERADANRVEASPDPFKALYLHALRACDPSLSLQILKLEREITERVPFYRLGCNLDPDAPEIVLRELERLEALRGNHPVPL